MIYRLFANQQFWSHCAQQINTFSTGQARVHIFVPYEYHQKSLQAALQRYGLGDCRISSFNTIIEQIQPTAAYSEKIVAVADQLRHFEILRQHLGAEQESHLWQLAYYLVTLAEEMTAAHIPAILVARQPPKSWQQSINTWIQRVQPLQLRSVLSEEAQLIWNVWRSLLDDKDLTLLRATHLRTIAKQYTEDIFVWIGIRSLSVLEADFLQHLPRTPHVLYADPTGDNNFTQRLPILAQASQWLAQSFALLMPQGESEPQLQFLPSTTNISVSVYAADSTKTEINALCKEITNWQPAHKKVGVVLLDNNASAPLYHQLHHALHAQGITIMDEVGRLLIQSRAATWLLNLLQLQLPTASISLCVDVMQASLWQESAVTPPPHEEMLCWHRTLLNSGDDWYGAKNNAPVLHQFFQQLLLRHPLWYKRRTLAQWQQFIHEYLHQTLHLTNMLKEVEGGAECCAFFGGRDTAAPKSEDKFGIEALIALLTHTWQRETLFMPALNDNLKASVTSSVTLLKLSGTRLRKFDVLWFIGAHADTLPHIQQERGFLPQHIYHELGLKSAKDNIQQQVLDLMTALLQTEEIVFSYSPALPGGSVEPSPWVLAITPEEKKIFSDTAITSNRVNQHEVAVLTDALFPRKISASAWRSLLACPFQFYGYYGLQLRQDEIADVPNKKNFGLWLHDILLRFYQQQPDFSSSDGLVKAQHSLQKISSEVFATQRARYAQALAYEIRWERIVPDYVAAEQEHAQRGWRFVAGEMQQELMLNLSGGRQVLLQGRLDRIDKRDADGAHALIDYKTEDKLKSVGRIRNHEEQQLIFYAILLVDKNQLSGFYIPLEQPGFFEDTRVQLHRDTLKNFIVPLLDEVAQGAALPANAEEKVCSYCELKGLCRRPHWEKFEAQ